MKKKTNFISMFVMISILGVAISFLNGDFDMGSYFEGLEINSIEVVLNTLNIGLGFVALVFLTIFLFYRSAREDNDQPLEATWVEDQED